MRPRRRRAAQEPTEPHVIFNTRVLRSLRQRVRRVCVEQGRQLQDFITEALREYLARHRKRGR